jgi:hypothetical protein
MDHEADVDFSLQQKSKIIEGNKRFAPETGGCIVGHDNDAHAATLLGNAHTVSSIEPRRFVTNPEFICGLGEANSHIKRQVSLEKRRYLGKDRADSALNFNG